MTDQVTALIEVRFPNRFTSKRALSDIADLLLTKHGVSEVVVSTTEND